MSLGRDRAVEAQTEALLSVCLPGGQEASGRSRRGRQAQEMRGFSEPVGDSNKDPPSREAACGEAESRDFAAPSFSLAGCPPGPWAGPGRILGDVDPIRGRPGPSLPAHPPSAGGLLQDESRTLRRHNVRLPLTGHFFPGGAAEPYPGRSFKSKKETPHPKASFRSAGQTEFRLPSARWEECLC